MRRPSLTLWRHRHLVVALCLGAAAVLTLSVLRPGPEQGREALVVARAVAAGQVIAEQDVTTRSLPSDALPANGLAGPEIIGSRAAIALEEGSVLTVSMTSAALADGLRGDERLVQVPVEVGAQLAEPGAHVDVVGEASAGLGEAPADSSAGSSTGTAADSPEDSSPGPGDAAAPYGPRTAVLCRNARVVLTTTQGEENRWTTASKVTLVTLAVPAADASLVVGAATNGALGVVLSP
jgi:hypothetical protein